MASCESEQNSRRRSAGAGVGNQKSLSRTITTSTRCVGNAGGAHGKFLTAAGVLLALFCLETAAPVAHGTPVGDRNDTGGSSEDYYTKGVKYLLKFAYLPQSDMETGELRSQEELRKSIMAFQRMAHLNETGDFDEATQKWMTRPRCGLPDVIGNTPGGTGRRSRRYVLGPSKWTTKRHLTWRLENWTPKLRHGQVRLAISKAFKLWSDVTYLSFREVGRSSPADINIRFSRGYHGDGYPFDSVGSVLAHAFYPGDNRGGDTHFDEEEPWTLYDPGNSGIDLYTVAAHEFGHALGLAHSHTLNSLMYPIYQGYSPDFRLHHDDITAIQILYGSKTPNVRPTYRPVQPTNPPYRPVTSSPTTTPGGATERSTTTATTMVPTTVKPTKEPMWSSGDCNGDFDAITYFRTEYYMFKGKYFWRADKKGLMPGFPIKISQFWYGFPQDLSEDIHIDAAYERPTDKKILFFIGKRYYLFHGNNLASRFPSAGKPLTDLGLPEDIEKIDAVFVWGHNKKTYFISHDMYWKYDERTQTIEQDYPRAMNMWQGVPVPVTSAITDRDGKTYFVKDSMVYEFENAFMKVADKPPQSTAERWLNCTLEPKMEATPTTGDLDGSAQGRSLASVMLVVLVAMISLRANLCSDLAC